MSRWRAIAVALVAGGCLAPGGPAPRLPAGEDAAPLWLVRHGWHVGLALRRADIPAGAWPEHVDVGPFTFFDVGWGDGEYYPAARGTTALALKAAFFSDFSVLHVVGFDAPVAVAFPDSTIIELRLPPDGLRALCRFIHDAYAHDAAGRIVRVAPAAYGQGWFYRARERYHVFDNSNTWAARALQAAGLPVSRVLTAGSLLRQGRGLGVVIRDGGERAGATPPASARTAASPRTRAARPACRAGSGSCSRGGSPDGAPRPA